MAIESDIRNVRYFPDGMGDFTIEGECVYEAICVVLAHADTRVEADAAKRAFEQVLAPRFTRDEAIAIVKAAFPDAPGKKGRPLARAEMNGVRLALEALAAAGVFSDAPGTPGQPKDVGRMADKLDAAGIK